MGDGWVGGWAVGKSDFKENPKSDLDLDLGFVNMNKIGRGMTYVVQEILIRSRLWPRPI